MCSNAIILTARLRQVDEDLAATTFLTVRGRVARAFFQLAECIGQPSSEGHMVFHERISQSDLAAIAGVARENVNRILSEWRLRKLITGSGRYCLTNIAALKREMNSGPPIEQSAQQKMHHS
jgi:CRP/FNR family transcriptional regulator, cyclic AMP receptor protein